MQVYIASDHGGIELKSKLVADLKEKNYMVKDLGPENKESVDYPDFAKKVTEAVAANNDSKGVLICRSGIGMSMAANKAENIRAALAYTPRIATLSRQHNNANVICFGADFISTEDASQALTNFLETEFEGGRHQRRVNKIR